MKRICFSILILCIFVLRVSAQEVTQDVAKDVAKDATRDSSKTNILQKFNVQLTGRAVFDAATYFQNDAAKEQDEDMHDGAAMRDVRIGFKAEYGKWFFKADLSFTGYKVAAKDLYLQYKFNKQNHIRLGHYSVPFGLSCYYSSAKKEYLDDPEANVFQFGRRIGILHTIYNHNLWGQYGVFADNSAMNLTTENSGPQGYTLGGRFVWRPVMNSNYGLHVGISGMHVKAESDCEGGNHVEYTGCYLTRVDRRAAIHVDLTDAQYENKFTAEFLGLYRNWQLCSQYYWSHTHRENNNTYNCNGYYVSLRGLIVNPANYKYNYDGSGVDNPYNKNLELMLGCGSLNLEDSKALACSYIEGMENAGRMHDFSAGLSFFWNKYVTLRLNYHYIQAKNYKQTAAKKVNVLQMRVQYIF